MSLESIRSASRQAAMKAARDKQKPFVVTSEDIADLQAGDLSKVKLPFLGDYVPRGFKLVRELFVDSSGFGATNEPALTQGQFYQELKPGFGYAVIEAGQFQVYVGEFEVKR